jgi:biopolymer transport protein TolR
MTIGGNQDRLMSDINVTPFVDVMLVLLIIFMVTAPMMVQGVNVDLPEASTQPLSSEKEHLVVTVNDQHQVFINDLQVEPDFLQEKLTRILQNAKNREVYFRADKTVSYGMVVSIMAEIKDAGVEKLGMITVPLQGDEKTPGKKP